LLLASRVTEFQALLSGFLVRVFWPPCSRASLRVQLVPLVNPVDRPRTAAGCRLFGHIEQLGRNQHSVEIRVAESIAQIFKLGWSFALSEIPSRGQQGPAVPSRRAHRDLAEHRDQATASQECQRHLSLPFVVVLIDSLGSAPARRGEAQDRSNNKAAFSLAGVVSVGK